MQVSVLMRCPPDSVHQNESLYIEALDTVHPRGYNLRCGSKAGAPSPCGMELSTIVVDYTEATDEMRKIVKEDIVEITCTPASQNGAMVVSIDDRNPTFSASMNSEKANGFPPTHNGIRFSKDMSMVDVMDCFTFVSASYGGARVLKTNYMTKTPLVPVVWEGSVPKRKRDTCTVSSMLKVLGLCTKPEAALLSSKISNLVQTTLTTANQIHNANSSKLIQKEKYEEAEAVEEYAYRKRMRDATEAQQKNVIKMDRLEKKIKFCKSIGDEERADRLMKVYINMH